MPKLIEVQAAKEFASTFLNDIFFKMAVNRVLDAAPAADVSVVTSAEKQAIFRLGQMDMRDGIVEMLRNTGKKSTGLVMACFLAAADITEKMEP